MIKEICNSKLVNQNAKWIWNGLDQNNLKLPIGIYIVVVELVDKNGRHKVVKHPVVISAGKRIFTPTRFSSRGKYLFYYF